MGFFSDYQHLFRDLPDRIRNSWSYNLEPSIDENSRGNPELRVVMYVHNSDALRRFSVEIVPVVLPAEAVTGAYIVYSPEGGSKAFAADEFELMTAFVIASIAEICSDIIAIQIIDHFRSLVTNRLNESYVSLTPTSLAVMKGKLCICTVRCGFLASFEHITVLHGDNQYKDFTSSSDALAYIEELICLAKI